MTPCAARTQAASIAWGVASLRARVQTGTTPVGIALLLNWAVPLTEPIVAWKPITGRGAG